ncbi:iron(III) transport system permease protein [Paenochrobactrum gallinarii]|uniref:Iron(III) transport system permease protein n=1 Tax=Paenochrobactrum gallinarii TaxID=643673 RepID=A0A841M720_9HYPH|nr:iron ABC transporter permease [Paenochrobactrum gallinarii]MBB6261938.1 iron(III) transport system permease protein [Paenochrobactrum gallinarii]
MLNTSHPTSKQPLRRFRSGSLWLIISLFIAGLMLLPILALLMQAFQGSEGLWSHLLATTLPVALRDTLILLTGVGFIAAMLGTTTAWLVTAYQFPGRRVLEWALLLPLAVPTYIIAYSYLDILHPIGPVQSAIRTILGYSSPREFRLPDIRSLTGCILLLGFVLYPYVYIPTRAMFLTQSANLIEAARTLGVSRRGIFWHVALPMARPAVAVGVSLALMETLNDIGAAEFLGVRSLTVSIYTTWITRSDLPGAAQIALALLLIVVLLVSFERWARRKQRFTLSTQRSQSFEPRQVKGLKGWLFLLLGAVPVMLGFMAPATYLIIEAWKRVQFAGISPRLYDEALNTILLAGTATIITLTCGVIIAYAMRLRPGQSTQWIFRLSTMGYAAPGTVIAIGVLIISGGLDRFIDQNMQYYFGVSTGLLLLGSGTALLYAYATRFMAISAGGIEAGLNRIPLSFEHAARTLGHTSTSTFRRVHLPLSKTALTAAALLVFVDCVKELPATLLLRPLNMETFATHLYGEAARGTYEEASLAALAIVAIGILPVILLAKIGRKL